MARDSKPWYWTERKAWYVTIRGKRHKLGTDKKAAKENFKRLQVAPAAVASSESVWAVLDVFLEWTETNRPASYSWYKEKLQLFKDAIPNCRIVDLQAAEIETWLGKKTAWSNAYKAGIVTAIKRVFNWAIKKKGLRFSPVVGLEKPTPGKRDRVLSSEEYESIQALGKDDCLRDVLALAWFTGARPQELTKMEARHLDRTNKTVVFPKAESKGKKRARVIFPTDECWEILTKWADRNPTGPILRNSKGRPWTCWAIACRFKKMKAKLGFKPVLYWFRHSYIHHGLTKGRIDPLTMATLVGHADLTMIYKYYGHLLKDADFMRDAAKKASASMPRPKVIADA